MQFLPWNIIYNIYDNLIIKIKIKYRIKLYTEYMNSLYIHKILQRLNQNVERLKIRRFIFRNMYAFTILEHG